MKQVIVDRLKDIERTQGIKILYAIESGSRAWGFASQDSDYDVRFIYVHHRDWYLSIEPKRDVIEFPLEGELDINGWDLSKALTLFRKSNPPLYEWLQSPIVYIKPHATVLRLRKLVPKFFSPKTCFMHYLSMAEKNYKDYAAKPEIKLKKYFYVLRPVFACHWIMHFGSMPPIAFNVLMERQRVSGALRQTIEVLLANKKQGTEKDTRPRIEVIDRYVEDMLAVFKSHASKLDKDNDLPYEPLNNLFRKAISAG